MRRAGLAAIALCSVAAAALGLGAQTPQPQAVFRATTDLVTIDVAVRSNGQPVGGLGVADFVLLDNGVLQTVEVAELEAVPVDITIMIDANEDDADNTRDLVAQARQIAALARPTDRVRVMKISTYVSDLIPACEKAELPAIPDLAGTGLSAAQDGLAMALLRHVEPDRRHLIIALTNGIDAISTIDAPTVRELARHSPATLYITQVNVALDDPHLHPPGQNIYVGHRERNEREVCGASGVCTPRRPYWRPYDDEQFDVLKEAAEITGGDLFVPGVFTNRTAAAVFEKAFADYRRSYVLRYTPQGVARTGWHEVSVTLPAHPGVEIKARRGYAMDASGRPPGAAGASTAPAAPAVLAALPVRLTPTAAIADLTAAYDAGQYDDVVAALAERARPVDLVREYQRAGNPWPANPKREAAFALELAHAALHSPARDAHDAAIQLLNVERKLVRDSLGPTPFEHYWLWGAVMVLEAANQPIAAKPFVDDAIARFPDEPRFLLARAVFLDQTHALDLLTPATAAFVKQVSEAYDRAIANDRTADEARLRKAKLLQRFGHGSEALELLDAMHDSKQDPGLTYLRHLFRAQALDALLRYDDATAEYRVALDSWPQAQSARVGLMAGLLRQGDRSGAETLAEAIQAAPATAVDPWWGYWLGDYRFYGEVIRQLREQR
ncbi:MAG TPA: hypothetical protein VLT86_01620 [Vicinamibacterales bacterium]|nr:hypothetical protein [Vicinamibacterales bacterium]